MRKLPVVSILEIFYLMLTPFLGICDHQHLYVIWVNNGHKVCKSEHYLGLAEALEL